MRVNLNYNGMVATCHTKSPLHDSLNLLWNVSAVCPWEMSYKCTSHDSEINIICNLAS